MQKLFVSLALIATSLFYCEATYSQSLDDDLNLVRAKTITLNSLVDVHEHHPKFLLADHPSAFVRYNPATLLFGSLMWIYQSSITQQLSSTCIYSPSCSSFSISLIQEFGILPGIFFTADRLTRCNRLALYDFPEREVDHRIHRIRQDVDYYKLKK